MTIKNGQLTSADEVMNAIGSNFNDTAQNIFNADYIGFDSRLADSGTPNYKNIKYDTLTSDTMTGGFYDSTDDKYLFITNIDECETGSIAASWTTVGGTTETSTYIQTTNDGQLTSDGTSPHDFYDATDVVHVRFRMVEHLDNGGAGTSGTSRWGLTDGSSTVWLKTFSKGADTSARDDDSIWDVYIDEANQKAHTYNDGVLDTADIDISTLTNNNFYFTMEVITTIISGYQRLHYLYANFVGDVINITSSSTATGDTVTNAISITNASNAIATNLSVDNGSNYESVTSTEIHRFTNTGTNLIFRATDTISSISIPTTLNQITEYAVKHSFY